MDWVQLGVWGDSIVHGGCDLEMGGWVNRLRLYLAGRGLGDHVFNLGLGGQNSAEVLARIGAELRFRAGHIDHVLVGVGMNDLAYPIKMLPVEEYRRNLEAIIAAVRAEGKTVRLLSLTPCVGVDTDKWQAMNAASREVAAATNAGWIDLRTCFPRELLADGLHPGAAGHAAIYCAVKEALLGAGVIPAE